MRPYYSFYHFPYSLQALATLSLKWSNGYVVKSIKVNCSQLVFIFEVCWFYFKAKESLKAQLLSLITLVIFMEDYLYLQTLPNQFVWPRTLLFRSFSNNTQKPSASDSSLRCRSECSALQQFRPKDLKMGTENGSACDHPWKVYF